MEREEEEEARRGDDDDDGFQAPFPTAYELFRSLSCFSSHPPPPLSLVSCVLVVARPKSWQCFLLPFFFVICG